MTARYSVLFTDGLLAALLFTIIFLIGQGGTKSEQERFVMISPEAAESLRLKIVSIREAESDQSRKSVTTIVISEIEIESFVLYEMEDEIPAKVESIDVSIDIDTISASTELTFSLEKTGNLFMDFLVGGTHKLFVQGRLEGRDGRGTFELRGVRVDGLPLPVLIVEALVDRFVKPRYPQVDLKESFEIPWGVEAVVLSTGNATISY